MSGSPKGEDGPASTQRPWLSSLVYSVIVALSPLAWVVETQSCSTPHAEPIEKSGIELFQQIDADTVPVFLLAPIVVVVLPFLAWKAPTLFARMVAHVLSLLASVWTALVIAAAITFTMFETRAVRPAGYLVVVLSWVPIIEAAVRIALGVREVRAARKPAPAGPPPDTG